MSPLAHNKILHWYHGTSNESGLDVNDELDPTKGQFEPCVWCTSDKLRAIGYAKDVCVILGGEPIVFEVELHDNTNIHVCQKGEQIDYRINADVIVDMEGEKGVPTLAILAKHVAKVIRVSRLPRQG